MENCGCKIVHGIAPSQDIIAHIEYCPLHTAAEALRDALAECVQSMGIATSVSFGCLPKAKAALAAAQGKETHDA